MIWLVWHRYRILIALTTVILGALAAWMLLAGHALSTAESTASCRYDTVQCHVENGTFSLSNQAAVINFLLLAIPCLLGVVFGAPLVAGEFEHYTNRLAWTQGISRTRWLLAKWACIALSLVILVGALTIVSQWWTGHAVERIVLDLAHPGYGRLQPLYFPITGLALSAYTLFAFALGTALGAILRKSSWAIAGTVVLYTSVSVLLLLFVRPSLAMQNFLPDPTLSTPAAGQAPSQYSEASGHAFANNPWILGFGYRYTPKAKDTNLSAATVALGCQSLDDGTYSSYQSCLTAHEVQSGTYYLAGTHYWDLQWRESGLLVAAAGALTGLTVWSVRRWRA